MTLSGCQRQGRFPLVILHTDIGALANENFYELGLSLAGRLYK